MATENGRGRPFCTLDCTSDGLNTIIPGIMKLFA